MKLFWVKKKIAMTLAIITIFGNFTQLSYANTINDKLNIENISKDNENLIEKEQIEENIKSETNGSETNGSETNGSETNGSETNGSETNGSETNGSEDETISWRIRKINEELGKIKEEILKIKDQDKLDMSYGLSSDLLAKSEDDKLIQLEPNNQTKEELKKINIGLNEIYNNFIKISINIQEIKNEEIKKKIKEKINEQNSEILGIQKEINEQNSEILGIQKEINELKKEPVIAEYKDVFTIEQKLDTIINTFGDLGEKDIKVKEIGSSADLKDVDIAIIPDTIELSNGVNTTENNIIGKENSKTRIIFNEITEGNSKGFLTIEAENSSIKNVIFDGAGTLGAEKLSIENVIFDGAGTHGGIINTKTGLTFSNVEFVNNNATDVINNATDVINNDADLKVDADTGIIFKNLIFKNNQAENIINNKSKSVKNADIIFEGNLLIENNLVSDSIIYNGEDSNGKIIFKNEVEFVNNKATDVIGNYTKGQMIFEGDVDFKNNQAKDRIIYNNDNLDNNNSGVKKTALEFKGNVNFINNQAKKLLHSHTTTEKNGKIIFGNVVNFFDNTVDDNLILNNRHNGDFIFNDEVNFIGNKSNNDNSIMISHTEGNMKFKGESKFINNSFGKAILYNGVAEEQHGTSGIPSSINIDKAVFLNNIVKDGAIIIDGETIEENGIKIKDNDVYIKINDKNQYNPKVFNNLIVVGNKNEKGKIIEFIGSTVQLDNMNKNFILNPNGGVFSGKTKYNLFELNDIKNPSRSEYEFKGWNPSFWYENNIVNSLAKKSEEIAKLDFSNLYRGEDKTYIATWEEIKRPSTGGGGSSSGKDKNRPKEDNKEETPKEEAKPEEQLIDGRPVGEVVKDYQNAVGLEKQELRKQLMGVKIEDGLDYKFKKEQHAAYLRGYSDETIRPNQYVTREEAASVIVRILEPRFVEDVETTEHDFLDVEKGRWSEGAIATLANGEIMNGYGSNEFRPTKAITRAELSRTVARFTDIVISETEFQDVITHWAEDYINSAQREGWIKGYDDGSFRPDNLITRAEFSALINSLLERRVARENILEGSKVYRDLDYNKWYYPVLMEAINGHNHDVNEYKDGTEIWLELVDEEF